jgi:hypothetical protein
MAAETTAAAWPSLDQYEAMTDKLHEASDEIDYLRCNLQGLVDPQFVPGLREDAPRPQLEEIAHLCLFCAHAEATLDAIKVDFTAIEELRDSVLFDVSLDGTSDGR